MTKRSPRYPRQNLSKSLEMVKKLFNGVHNSKVDMDTAAKVIGYAGSGGGAASSALGALRQFGLVDGLRGDIAVSELTMRIIQPMNDSEKAEALHEAATKPEVFGRVITQFGGKLPLSDEPIIAFLIRQEGFSAIGASELIEALRDTISNLPELPKSTENAVDTVNVAEVTVQPTSGAVSHTQIIGGEFEAANAFKTPNVGELITLPLGQGCKAELRLIGDVNLNSYNRLIRHLELLRDILAEDDTEN